MYGERTLLIQRLEGIDRLSGNVHHTALDLLAYRHCDRTARYAYIHAATQAVGGVHGDAAHGILADVLLHLDDELAPVGARHVKRFVNGRKGRIGTGVTITDIDDRADDLADISCEYCHDWMWLSNNKYNKFSSRLSRFPPFGQ